jgi:phosphoribosylamine--glycine ligase
LARLAEVAPDDLTGLGRLVERERLDLVVVGPEVPLAAGIVDYLSERGVAVLGPSQAAARLESSKVFAKQFMARHGIPTAAFRVFDRAEDALDHCAASGTRYPLVVKADGLAAGKGVVVARAAAEARDAVERIMVAREFGSAGDRLLIEDCLVGREASFIVFTDGETIVPAVAAEDHKAVLDGDLGPNTGGMGAYSVPGLLDAALEERVMAEVVRPTIAGMKSEGAPFRGILYAGLMLTAQGPLVLEYNVRMGDPEAQVILPRLESDFADLAASIPAGRLGEQAVCWSSRAAVCVVLASAGYPGRYERGKPISGLEMATEDRSVVVFHSGTRRAGEAIVTDGGRVLGVTATAPDLPAAIAAAYGAVNRIRFEGMHYRRDIGARRRAA